MELLGIYGSDLTVAQAAWTSTNRELTSDKLDRVPKMIETLYQEGHMTPFERIVVHFLVDVDVATHIHLIKHRMMGINGESARYKELKEDRYHIPEDWVDNPVLETYRKQLEEVSRLTNSIYHECLNDLTPILGRARAKESARYFKLYNSKIKTDVIMNMSAFSNFYWLRGSSKAQKEIRDIAHGMMEILSTRPEIQHTVRMIKSRHELMAPAINTHTLLKQMDHVLNTIKELHGLDDVWYDGTIKGKKDGVLVFGTDNSRIWPENS